MLDQMLRVFGLRPDHDLGVMKAGQNLAEVTAACLTGLDRILRRRTPGLGACAGGHDHDLCRLARCVLLPHSGWAHRSRPAHGEEV